MTFKYKTPMWLEFNIHKLIWILTLYYWIYYTFFLGNQTQAFYQLSFSSPFNKQNIDEYVPKYEQVYYFDRPTLR